MSWLETISEGLPPPHEAEPSDLRSDIVDELADHLAMAMKRELRRNEDESIARRAVLSRFGDPLAVARRLWWDAMKEKIMKDRLILIGFVVVLVGVLAALGVSWAAQSRINQAILAKLETLSSRSPAPAVPENWAKVEIRVVEGTRAGPPVAGVFVTLTGKAFTDSDRTDLHVLTDAQGCASFGPVRPGQYDLDVQYGELGLFVPSSKVALYPGQAFEQVLVCPSKAAQGKSELPGQGPARLARLGIDCRVPLGGAEPVVVDGTRWSIREQMVRLNLAGEIMQVEFTSSNRPSPSPPGRPSGPGPMTFTSRDPVTTVSSTTWMGGKYRFGYLRLYRPEPDTDAPKTAGRSWLKVGPSYEIHDGASESWSSFEVKMGQANTWTIELPKGWVEQVHDGIPVDVAFRFQGVPEWLEPDALIECETYLEKDALAMANPDSLPPLSTWRVKLTGEIITEIGTHPYRLPAPGGLPGVSSRGGTDIMWRGSPKTERAAVLLPRQYKLRSVRLYRPIPSRDPDNPKALYWRQAGGDYPFRAGRRPQVQPEVGRANVWTIELPADWLEQVRGGRTRNSARQPRRRGAHPVSG